ncbi:mycofactocin-associated electron transfer flavoprotein beta subunit [Streptomyces sp. NPDC051921]|uniref:mycofactocin-associated electron transfer flavoprotein beta subunit n=1 Tax=Streptomyces sp. NPDC051921 TaxID=3155806 RepID=UPI00342C9FAD
MLITAVLRGPDAPGGPHPADLHALERALHLADRLDGLCVVAALGGAGADDALRDALAAGAHAALRVEPATGPGDGDTRAAALLDAVTRHHGPPRLVLFGAHDEDDDGTPAFLAARLGAAQALGLLELDNEGAELRALRRLDHGRRELLAVPLPAVCSVTDTGARPPRAALGAVITARTAPIPVTRATPGPGRVRAGRPRPFRARPRYEPAPEGDHLRRLAELTGALVPRTPTRLVTPAGPAAAADELIAYLTTHGYLPAPPREQEEPA